MEVDTDTQTPGRVARNLAFNFGVRAARGFVERGSRLLAQRAADYWNEPKRKISKGNRTMRYGRRGSAKGRRFGRRRRNFRFGSKRSVATTTFQKDSRAGFRGGKLTKRFRKFKKSVKAVAIKNSALQVYSLQKYRGLGNSAGAQGVEWYYMCGGTNGTIGSVDNQLQDCMVVADHAPGGVSSHKLFLGNAKMVLSIRNRDTANAAIVNLYTFVAKKRSSLNPGNLYTKMWDQIPNSTLTGAVQIQETTLDVTPFDNPLTPMYFKITPYRKYQIDPGQTVTVQYWKKFNRNITDEVYDDDGTNKYITIPGLTQGFLVISRGPPDGSEVEGARLADPVTIDIAQTITYHLRRVGEPDAGGSVFKAV